MSRSDLNTRIKFFEYAPSPGPEPGEIEKRLLWECWAEVYEPSIKDQESLSAGRFRYAVTVRIRDPRREYKPNNKHYISVLADAYKESGEYIRFNIKKIQPDLKDKRFIKVVAEAVE